MRAIAWFGADEDGLKRPWKGSVHVFPPLDRVPAFALKVLDELAAGRVTRAALLAPFDRTDSCRLAKARPHRFERSVATLLGQFPAMVVATDLRDPTRDVAILDALAKGERRLRGAEG